MDHALFVNCGIVTFGGTPGIATPPPNGASVQRPVLRALPGDEARTLRDTPSSHGFIGTSYLLDREGWAPELLRAQAEAGISRLHPHMFRHTFANRYLRAGGSEGDLAGWKDRQMVDRYGASAAAERATDAHGTFSPDPKCWSIQPSGRVATSKTSTVRTWVECDATTVAHRHRPPSRSVEPTTGRADGRRQPRSAHRTGIYPW